MSNDNLENSLDKKTDDELLVLHREYALYVGESSGKIRFRLVDTELQRRWQQANSQQIGTVIKEISELKGITDKNIQLSAESEKRASRLARVAISLAMISVVLQFVSSIDTREVCSPLRVIANDGSTRISDCYRIFDIGLLGEYKVKISDIVE